MRDDVLSLLTEDYYGLWELQVQLRSERGHVARAVQELLDAGLVEWFHRASDASPAVPAGSGTPPCPDLDADLPWQVPQPSDEQWLLGATKAGESAYFGTGA